MPRLVEQKLLTFPEHMSSFPVFSGVRVTQSLVLCACFVDRYLSFCTVFFGHYVLRRYTILITPLVSSNSSYKKQEVLNLFDSPAGFHLFKFSVLWCVFVFCLSSLCVLCIQY